MNWKSILASALVTGVVTLAAGLFLFWLQAKEPKLIYSSVLSEPFIEENYSRYIQQIDIVNSGDTFLENVSFSIIFSNARITDHGVKIDPTISYHKEVEDNLVKINLDNLNEDETIRVSLILMATESELVEPKISLRATNVTGKMADKKKKDNIFPIIVALISAYIGLFAALLSTRAGRNFFQRLIGMSIPRRLFEDQVHVIASALAISGLSNRAKEILYPPQSRRYWVESDLLGSEAISSNDEETRTKILTALRILLKNDGIALSSRAIIMCNIARILDVSGNTEEAVDTLRSGREFSKRTLDDRVELDPLLKKYASALADTASSSES